MKPPQWEILATAALITLTVWVIPSSFGKIKQRTPFQIAPSVADNNLQYHRRFE